MLSVLLCFHRLFCEILVLIFRMHHIKLSTFHTCTKPFSSPLWQQMRRLQRKFKATWLSHRSTPHLDTYMPQFCSWTYFSTISEPDFNYQNKILTFSTICFPAFMFYFIAFEFIGLRFQMFVQMPFHPSLLLRSSFKIMIIRFSSYTVSTKWAFHH